MRRRLLGLALAALLVTPTTSAFASAAGDGDPPAHVAVLGQRYRSELTRQAILNQDGSRGEVWEVQGAASDCVTVGMDSPDFSPYVRLTRDQPDGGVLGYADAAGARTAEFRVELPSAGRYFVKATSSGSGERLGRYTLAFDHCARGSSAPPAGASGVSLRRVSEGPAPLYLGAGVPSAQADWAQEAMRIAWREVPGLLDLPLPATAIPVYLFRDADQWSEASAQLIGAGVGHEGCSAYTGQERMIFCNASVLRSREMMMDFLVHEFTHQVVQGDLPRRRALAVWYNEGLAEYVMQQVLTTYAPAYAASDAARRARRVAEAQRRAHLLQLEPLVTNQQWLAVDDLGLAYSESRLAVRWLAERDGLERVVDVVRQTTSTPGSFDRAFEATFGLTVREFDRQFPTVLPTLLAVASPG